MKIFKHGYFKHGYHLILNTPFKLYLITKGKCSKKVLNKPYQVVWVPTRKIHEMVPNFPKKRYVDLKIGTARSVGSIMDGTWDQEKKNFFNVNVYNSFVQRFTENKNWEDTDYYESFYKRLNKNGHGRGHTKTWEDFKQKRLLRYDKLFNDIKQNGYKSQKKANKINKKTTNEIEVAIGRKGEILFIDGRHRLSIANILNIEYIPVIINVVHKSYFENHFNSFNTTPQDIVDYLLNYQSNDDAA